MAVGDLHSCRRPRISRGRRTRGHGHAQSRRERDRARPSDGANRPSRLRHDPCNLQDLQDEKFHRARSPERIEKIFNSKEEKNYVVDDYCNTRCALVVRIDRPHWGWLDPFVAGHRGGRAYFPTDLRSQSCGLTSLGATARSKARAVMKPPSAGQYSNRAARKSVALSITPMVICEADRRRRVALWAQKIRIANSCRTSSKSQPTS